MTNTPLEAPDWRLLRYFAVVAEEGGLRRAAERLCMTQPPLSRHIKRLEDALGMALFTRHSTGLTLTDEGKAVLRVISPVLAARQAANKRLLALAHTARNRSAHLRIGLTTAFEQGIFAGFARQMENAWPGGARLARHSSPQLARAVRRGELDAALVALPLATQGLRLHPLAYEEPLLAVVPASWPEAEAATLALRDLSGRPLFWFKRESSPAFFDLTKAIFAASSFAPLPLEEPEEYDVLLARIAQGEGMGLLPRSFSAIGRSGVAFRPLAEGGLLRLRLGLALPGGTEADAARPTAQERAILEAAGVFAPQARP